MAKNSQRRAALKGDAGVGLIEVAVAIIVLGVVLVAFLPILASSIQLAVKNQTVAEANQLLASELGFHRTRPPAPNATICTASPGAAANVDLTVVCRVVTPGSELATIEVKVTSTKYGNLTQATTQVETR